MDILNNLYIVSAKNKHMIPTALFFLVNMIVRKEKLDSLKEDIDYLGDNLPLNLVERIRCG